jgi:hypothetical protein
LETLRRETLRGKTASERGTRPEDAARAESVLASQCFAEENLRECGPGAEGWSVHYVLDGRME